MTGPVRLTDKETIDRLLAEIYDRDCALREARVLIGEAFDQDVAYWPNKWAERAEAWLAATAQETEGGDES